MLLQVLAGLSSQQDVAARVLSGEEAAAQDAHVAKLTHEEKVSA